MQPQPPMTPEGRAPSRTLEKVGMGVGGGLAFLGILMWSAASSKQQEIDDAPTETAADFVHLQQLEKDADGLAGGGNLFFFGGVVLAGVSAYLYVRKGRQARSARTAVIPPTVFPHAPGLVLPFGEPHEPDATPGEHGAEHVQAVDDAPVDDQVLAGHGLPGAI